MSKQNKNSGYKDKIYEWQLKADERCFICGEECCQDRWTRHQRVVLVRDCQPKTIERLPDYLLKALKGYI